MVRLIISSGGAFGWLWLSLASATAIGSGLAAGGAATPRRVLAVEESHWLRHQEPIHLEVYREGAGPSVVYRLVRYLPDGKKTSKSITPDRYQFLLESFSSLAREVASQRLSRRCASALHIELSDTRDRALICQGDYRDYFEARGILSQLD